MFRNAFKITDENFINKFIKDFLKTILFKGKKFFSYSKNIIFKIKKKSFYFLLIFVPMNLLIKIVKNKIINKHIILIYHSFGSYSNFYCLKNDSFYEHIDILKKLEVKFCHTDLFFVKESKPKVLITFDDGYKSSLDIIENLFFEKINALLFITTSFVDSNYNSYMTWDDLLQISSNKLIEIGSHCVNHMPLDGLNINDIEKELSNSKNIIKNKINYDTKLLAYPFGNYNNEVKKIAKKYYNYAFTSVESINKKSIFSDPYDVIRLCIDKSHERKKKFLADIYLNSKKQQ